MASPENKKATEPPTSRPMNVVGLDTLIWVAAWWNREAPVALRLSWEPMVSTKEANRATAAMTAEPMATPLVIALVVLPTASRLTMIRSASPVNSPDISATPAALSATGPKLSSDTTIPVADSIPMPVSATRYSDSSMLPWPRPMATAMAPAMATIAQTEDSSPELTPDRTVVAGPVRAASAISLTGDLSVEVKYSVIKLSSWPSTTPANTAQKTRRLCTYSWATSKVPTTVIRLEARKARLMGAMAVRSRPVALTRNTPMAEARRPKPATMRGNTTPRAGLRPMDLKAAKPRISEAMIVIS